MSTWEPFSIEQMEEILYALMMAKSKKRALDKKVQENLYDAIIVSLDEKRKKERKK
jgi:transposase